MEGKVPKCGVLVRVEELFMHCAKAFKRSKLWSPDAQVPRGTLPGLARIVLEQTEVAKKMSDQEIEKSEAELQWHYKNELYE